MELLQPSSLKSKRVQDHLAKRDIMEKWNLLALIHTTPPVTTMVQFQNCSYQYYSPECNYRPHKKPVRREFCCSEMGGKLQLGHAYVPAAKKYQLLKII